MALDDPPRCERCNRVAEVVIVTTHTTAIMGLRRPEVETHSTSKRRVLCGECSIPAAFAASEGVRDVINGDATEAIVSIPTRRL